MIHANPEAPTLSRHSVRRQIERSILSGEFAPGSRLKQMELARRFGVAQTVVRESLLELRVTGLVDAVDNLGMFVADLSTGKLLQAYEIREVLEGLAARLCCEKAGRSTVRELETMAAHIYELGQAGDLDHGIALDRAFHQLIIATSGNALMSQLTGGYRVLGMAVWANRDLAEVRDEHLAIAKAIGENRADDAEKLARQHVRHSRESIERLIRSGEFKPRWVLEGAPSTTKDTKPAKPVTK